jgi:hypothetical protein
MDWSGVRNRRLLAGLYLVAFVSTYVGVVLVLIAQWTSSPTIVGAVAFFGGLLGIAGLALGLRNRVTRQPGRLTAKASNHQRAYQRLALGIELPQAWRALTN